MGCTMNAFPMAHGLYNELISHGPWAVQYIHYLYLIQYAISQYLEQTMLITNGFNSVQFDCYMILIPQHY